MFVVFCLVVPRWCCCCCCGCCCVWCVNILLVYRSSDSTQEMIKKSFLSRRLNKHCSPFTCFNWQIMCFCYVLCVLYALRKRNLFQFRAFFFIRLFLLLFGVVFCFVKAVRFFHSFAWDNRNGKRSELREVEYIRAEQLLKHCKVKINLKLVTCVRVRTQNVRGSQDVLAVRQ